MNILEIGIARGRDEGKAEGKAEAIIELLSEIGDVPPSLMEKITAQGNLEVLGKWLKLAAKSPTIQEFMSKM